MLSAGYALDIGDALEVSGCISKLLGAYHRQDLLRTLLVFDPGAITFFWAISSTRCRRRGVVDDDYLD